MFIVKLKDVLNSKTAFDKLIVTPMSIKTNRRVRKIIEQVNNEFNEFEKLRKELIIKLGVKQNDSDDSYQVTNESQDEFFKEINEILEEEVIFNCFKLQENEIPSSFELTPTEFGSFDSFVEITEE